MQHQCPVQPIIFNHIESEGSLPFSGQIPPHKVHIWLDLARGDVLKHLLRMKRLEIGPTFAACSCLNHAVEVELNLKGEPENHKQKRPESCREVFCGFGHSLFEGAHLLDPGASHSSSRAIENFGKLSSVANKRLDPFWPVHAGSERSTGAFLPFFRGSGTIGALVVTRGRAPSEVCLEVLPIRQLEDECIWVCRF